MQGCQWVAGTGWRALRGAPRMSVPGQAVRSRSLAGLPLQSWLVLAATALALVFPFVADSYATYVALLIAYQVITVTGLSLLMGYTGQGSIAHPGFAAIGGYVSTLLMLHAGWPFWVAAPATGLLAGLVGYLLGFPALRLSGHYQLLVTLGFRIVATGGTAVVLREAGVPVETVKKVLEGRPNIVDLMKNGDIQLVFNTTEGRQSLEDSFSLRRTALMMKIPYYTTAAGALAAAQAIGAMLAGELEVRPLQSY